MGTASILQYNYYQELNDVVTRVEYVGSSTYKLVNTLLRRDDGFKLPGLLEFLFEDAFLAAKKDAADASFVALMTQAQADAAMGDCEPFKGYNSEFIVRPFLGLYDKNFWCLK